MFSTPSRARSNRSRTNTPAAANSKRERDLKSRSPPSRAPTPNTQPFAALSLESALQTARRSAPALEDRQTLVKDRFHAVHVFAALPAEVQHIVNAAGSLTASYLRASVLIA